MNATISRKSTGPVLVLEDSLGTTNDLIEIKTSMEKRESKEKLRANIAIWLDNPNFDEFRTAKIDLAIVIYVNAARYNGQDCDNIAKVVLDAISNTKKHPKSHYLIENDSQVIRLLVYKMMRVEAADAATDGLLISFRLHNPKKQMILIEQDALKSSLAYRRMESDSVEINATTKENGNKHIDLKIEEKLGVSDKCKTNPNPGSGTELACTQ